MLVSRTRIREWITSAVAGEETKRLIHEQDCVRYREIINEKLTNINENVTENTSVLQSMQEDRQRQHKQNLALLTSILLAILGFLAEQVATKVFK